MILGYTDSGSATKLEHAVAVPELDKRTRKGIFATDAAAILGVAPESWPTAVDVYLRNVAGKPSEELDPELADYGLTVQPFVLRSLERRIGRQVIPNAATYLSHELPWLGASPDGFVPDENAGVEGKAITFTRAEWGEPGTAQIPLHYAVQVAVGMMVTQLRKWYVPVAFGCQVELYLVEWDAPLFDQIRTQLDAFRREHILAEVPPTPRTLAEARVRWPRDTGKTIEATPHILERIMALREARELLKQAEAAKESVELEVKSFMGDYAAIEGDDGKQLITWKLSAPAEKIDSKRLRNEEPEIFERFKIVQPGSRRFLVK
jgi:predicted phage-related endonuclease